MLDVTTPLEAKAVQTDDTMLDSKPAATAPHAGAPLWETPKLEDVSEQVMAQPYIRFT